MEKVSLDQANKIIATGEPVFIIFSTTWCGDCVVMKEMLKPLLLEFANTKIRFLEIDRDTDSSNIDRAVWNVEKVPSFYVIKNAFIKHIGYEFIPIDLIKAEIIKII